MDSGVTYGRITNYTKENDFFSYYNRIEANSEKTLINPNEEIVTYRTLDLMVQNISQNFHKLFKVKPNEIVALLIPNGCNRIAAILALSKLGIPFCPLEEPITEKMLFCMLQIKANILITKNNLDNEFHANLKDLNIVNIKTLLVPVEGLTNDYTCSIMKNSLFCVLFTSGSTGNPKAVKLTHENMIQTVEWFRSDFVYELNEMMCSKTNFIFIDYFTETLSAMCMKESCLFLTPDQVKNSKLFLDFLSKYKVTRLYTSVSLLRSLLLLNNSYNSQLYLREIWSSGEDLHHSLVIDFFKCFPHVKLWNVYGSSETCGNVMYSKMDPSSIVDASKETFIGEIVLPDTVVYLVDSSGNLINNLFEIGELWVAGSVVSPGYLAEDVENLKYFEKNPFYYGADEKLKTVYKTGDFAVRRENGFYKVGRNKDFFKIRGNKVNISEIEKIIQSFYPSYLVAVVAQVVKEITEIYCFISPPATSIKCVLKSLSSKMAPFMIPRVLFIDTMPKTDGSDKIDRQKLISLIPSNRNNVFSIEEISLKPVKSQFEIITAMALNTDISTIDLDCSFFELGGDSVSVWVYIENLRKIGFDVTFENVSAARSINEIIDKLTTQSNNHEQPIKDQEIKVYNFSEASNDVLGVLYEQHAKAFFERDVLTKYLMDPNFEIKFRCFMKKIITSFPCYSFYAMLYGKPVGAVLCHSLSTPLDLSFSSAIDEMISLYEKVLDKIYPLSKFKVLDVTTLHANLDLPRDIACQVIVELSKRVVEFAIEQKFDVVSTLNNNEATFKVDTSLLGFVHVANLDLGKICIDGEYPFKSGKDIKSRICIKCISESARSYFSDELKYEV
ncbi:beta-alanyl-bioamine nonribosomal peptide synthetase ebony [Hydra vulgaris]|uniref:beta-alanyl-bioamine nonribosomal peptide synthetase ebony n=1 Tax=Hydra vulgaris TaxID=6087 RepID=UPI001F5E9FC9|nr:plipastatin synthase subunit B-like [Hydra vulgaris]XP_047143453.1 plipastatin synthase subunit B-like [Hydra vulgaris]XP_047143455.1 plipastatin synthase subunit B-like [Hydra vulgaris]XP_047143456.1 plipastatin synthase subunit B-like [Hydra vulgaris]XP_047143457.1 plipastatin synthase subunit B-like [Hydra vulgaris]